MPGKGEIMDVFVSQTLPIIFAVTLRGCFSSRGGSLHSYRVNLTSCNLDKAIVLSVLHEAESQLPP